MPGPVGHPPEFWAKSWQIQGPTDNRDEHASGDEACWTRMWASESEKPGLESEPCHFLVW